jgi:hypothetical protein
MAGIHGSLIDANSIAGNKLLNNAEVLRTQLKQYPDVSRVITPFEWVVWDSGAKLTTAANDDLGIVMGTFGTNCVTVQAGDVKATNSTRYALAHVWLPDYYDAGQTVTLRFLAGMQTTVADTTCTIDAVVYEVDDDGTPTADGDICATAAQSINSLTAANKDFTITPTNLVAGDILEIRVAIAYNDGATVTAVTPTIYKAALLFDARG